VQFLQYGPSDGALLCPVASPWSLIAEAFCHGSRVPMQAASSPKVILYAATSLDGRSTGFSVDLEQFYSLAQGIGEDCSLVGCDTLLAAPDDIPEDDGSEAPFAAAESGD